MPRGTLLRTLLAGVVLCCPPQGQGTAIQDHKFGKWPVTVFDAIEMTEIGDRSIVRKGDSVVQFSPDGSKFAFVTQRGDLTTDTVEFRLVIFKVAEAFKSPRPEVVATLASSSNREGIRQVQWLSDNETLAFLGEHPGETSQLYRVDSRTKKLEKLTNQPTPILSYCMSARGDSFVYVAEASPRPVVSDEVRSRGFFVTSQQWDDLYTNRRHFDTKHEIFVKAPQMGRAERVGDGADLNPFNTGLSISPNGRYALLWVYTTSPPSIWNRYVYKADYETAPSAGACNAREVFRCPQQIMIVDLRKRTIEPLLNAPVSGKTAGIELAAWTGQSSVFLVNALLPIDSVKSDETSRRISHVYAAEVTLPEREILKISEREKPYPAFFIESDAANDRITTKTGIAAMGPPLEFRKRAGSWQITQLNEASSHLADRLSVTLDQDINSPPMLVAHDQKTGQKAVLLDLNPQFSHLTFGRVEILSFKLHDGSIDEATLYYPPNYVPGRRYPLVIQTHDERRDQFWIDGPYSTAYAAQPLANKGFLVLQMGQVDIYEKTSLDELYKFFGTSQEGPHYTALFESAIDELDKRGLIDPNRVGLSGFSRTAYHVLYALTHSNRHFAAAVAADGVNFGYVWCFYYLANSNSICEKINGGLPFSDGLTDWVKAAPTFRLDKVEAPLLLQAISSPLGEWEIFIGLRWLKKPVELLNFYPEGVHELVKPQQRLLSEGSVVDWYCFWLKGEEDPDPAKAEQYARWRKMKLESDKENAQLQH